MNADFVAFYLKVTIDQLQMNAKFFGVTRKNTFKIF